MCTTFDDCSLIRSRGMVGAHQKLNGSRDLTTPLSRMIRHPWASTCYDQPIYQIWSPYLHPSRRYDSRYQMSKMRWFWVVRRHSMSLEIAPLDRACEFLLMDSSDLDHVWYISSLGSCQSAAKRHLDRFSCLCGHRSKDSPCFSTGRACIKTLNVNVL